MASVTGIAPDGVSFLVSHEGVTAPATMGDLAPYPDLQKQAIDLSSQALTQPLVPAPATETVPGTGADRFMAKILDPRAAADLGLNPSGQMVAAPPPVNGPNVAETPPPAPGTEGMAPAGAAQPAGPAQPAGGAAPMGGSHVVPRGTGGGGAAPAPAQASDDLATLRQQEEAKGKIAGQGLEDLGGLMKREKDFQTMNALAQQQRVNQWEDMKQRALAAHNLDPNKFWHDKGTLGGILFTISAMAQGAAGGFNGHPEAGTNYIENAIKQNLEIQAKKAEALDKATEAQGNLVQMGRQAGLDHLEATKAALPLMNEMTAKSLEQTAYKLGPGGNSAAFLAVAQDLRKKNAENAQIEANTGKAKAETGLAGANTAKARAETGKIAMETGQTMADRVAIGMASQKQPIPALVEQHMTAEGRKNLAGPQGARYMVNNADKVNEKLSDYGQYDASLNLAHQTAMNPKASPEQLDQAANQAKVAAKVANELKRGGDSDKDLLSLNPGFGEFLGTKIDWAQPGRRERFAQLVSGERVNQAKRTSGAVQPYGHPGVSVPLNATASPVTDFSNLAPTK